MNHQRLKCYCILLSIAKRMPRLTQMLPKGNYYIEDQLKRALSSAILNLAEGNGRTSIKERNRFFDISLASISEVAAGIDIISSYGYLPANHEEEIKNNLRSAYAMIMKLKKISP